MQNLVDGRALHRADLSQRGKTLVQPLVQCVRRPAGRPGPHPITRKRELLCEQMPYVARADEAHSPLRPTRVVHKRQANGSTRLSPGVPLGRRDRALRQWTRQLAPDDWFRGKASTNVPAIPVVLVLCG